jgi:TRAP-type C4-dicarboxylate transport system permease small subunit
MSVSYTCPDPNCGVTLKTPNRVAVGKSVKCPKCGNPFVPEPAGLSAGERPAAAAAPAAAGKQSPLQAMLDDEDSEESVRKGYGVIKDSEEEVKEAKKNRPKFTEVQDKFKKSARGPAQALLVMPSNLLVGAGILLCALSVVYFIVGMWPLVFNDAPPGEEELDEAVFAMLMGVLGFIWGGIVVYGASQMQELGSYIFAMLGAVMGIPLLVGVFALIMLFNPKVKAGFEEAEVGPDELEDDEDEKPDDEEEDGEKPRRKKKESDGSRRAKKAAGMLGGMLLGAVLGDEEGGDDDGGAEDDDEPEDEEDDEEVDEADDEDDDDNRRKRRKKRR